VDGLAGINIKKNNHSLKILFFLILIKDIVFFKDVLHKRVS